MSMTQTQFLNTVQLLCARFGGSVTSWLRSPKRNQEVGGHPESYHLTHVGQALDVVLDHPADKQTFIAGALRYGLKAIDEGDHIHLQTQHVSAP